MEIDNYDSDPHITITEGGDVYTMWVTYKTPEVLSYQQEQYLTQQIMLLDNLIYGDKNSDKLWEYLDMDALAKFYIVQEITDNYESFHGSCYLHKDMGANAKWHFGPVWDFGSSFNRDKSQYIYQGDVWHNHWIPEICQFPAFMNRVKEIWSDFYTSDINDIYSFIDAHESQISQAAAKDKQRWPQYHGSQSVGTYIDRTTNVLRQNIAWLNEQWGSNTGNNDNPSDDKPGDNDDDEDENHTGNLSELISMCVWSNGQFVEYPIEQVDSITFIEKEALVVKVQVPDAWLDDIYVYIWNTEGVATGDYKATKQGDWYAYTYFGKELNIIFKKGKGWTGEHNQTEDLTTNHSGCYILTQKGTDKAKYNAVDCK